MPNAASRVESPTDHNHITMARQGDTKIMTSTFSNRLALRLRRIPATPIASAVSLALMGLPAAQAQTAPAAANSETAEQPEDIVVTGYRSSIERSLDQKRDADAIIDVISAEDVGKFPDKNVADALQRVPGVIVDRDGGEGKYVSVRGLAADLTLTQLNENYVATAESNGDPTRSFNYTLMPSNMLSSAELFKTPEARIDEGGVGGTVILRTRRPLDVEAGSGFVTAEGTTADTTDNIDGQFSGQYAWHDKSERFGVLVGYTQQKRTSRTMGASTENWQWYADDYDTNPATDVNGKPSSMTGQWWGESGFYDQNGNYYTNFMLPTSVNFNVKSEDREREGGQLTLQFKPDRQPDPDGKLFPLRAITGFSDKHPEDPRMEPGPLLWRRQLGRRPHARPVDHGSQRHHRHRRELQRAFRQNVLLQ
jgi:hypothetical protein